MVARKVFVAQKEALLNKNIQFPNSIQLGWSESQYNEYRKAWKRCYNAPLPKIGESASYSRIAGGIEYFYVLSAYQDGLLMERQSRPGKAAWGVFKDLEYAAGAISAKNEALASK